MMDGRELRNHVINARIATKRAAPHLTAAKNALKKGISTLKAQVGDLDVIPYGADGKQLNCALPALQRGELVTLKAWRQVGEDVLIGSFNVAPVEAAGELTISIKVT